MRYGRDYVIIYKDKLGKGMQGLSCDRQYQDITKFLTDVLKACGSAAMNLIPWDMVLVFSVKVVNLLIAKRVIKGQSFLGRVVTMKRAAVIGLGDISGNPSSAAIAKNPEITTGGSL